MDDVNLLCYKVKKADKYVILDKYIEKINSLEADEYIVQVGDYAPDGDKYEYFEYFLERVNKPLKLIGPYCIFEHRIAKFPNVISKEVYVDTYGVMVSDEMLMQYPNADKVKRATMRISNGCPRSCKMCPVPVIHNQFYKLEPMAESLKMIQEYYDRGVRLITFIDDNMGVNINKFKEFLLSIKAMNLKGLKLLSLEGFEIFLFQDEEVCQLLKETKWIDIKTGMENIKIGRASCRERV